MGNREKYLIWRTLYLILLRKSKVLYIKYFSLFPTFQLLSKLLKYMFTIILTEQCLSKRPSYILLDSLSGIRDIVLGQVQVSDNMLALLAPSPADVCCNSIRLCHDDGFPTDSVKRGSNLEINQSRQKYCPNDQAQTCLIHFPL